MTSVCNGRELERTGQDRIGIREPVLLDPLSFCLDGEHPGRKGPDSRALDRCEVAHPFAILLLCEERGSLYGRGAGVQERRQGLVVDEAECSVFGDVNTVSCGCEILHDRKTPVCAQSA